MGFFLAILGYFFQFLKVCMCIFKICNNICNNNKSWWMDKLKMHKRKSGKLKISHQLNISALNSHLHFLYILCRRVKHQGKPGDRLSMTLYEWLTEHCGNSDSFHRTQLIRVSQLNKSVQLVRLTLIYQTVLNKANEISPCYLFVWHTLMHHKIVFFK